MSPKLCLLLSVMIAALTGLVGSRGAIGQDKKPQFEVGEQVIVKWKERRVLGKVKEDVSQFYGRVVEFEFDGAKQARFFLEQDIEYPIPVPPAQIVQPSLPKGKGTGKPFDPNEPFPGDPPMVKFVPRKEPRISNIKLLEMTKSEADKLSVFVFSMTIEPGAATIGTKNSEHFFWVCVGDPGEIGQLRDEISDLLKTRGAPKALGRETYSVNSVAIRRSQKSDEKNVWIVPIAFSNEQLAGDEMILQEAKYKTTAVPLFFVVADDEHRVSDEVAYKLDATKLRALPRRTSTLANVRKAWQLGSLYGSTARALATNGDRMAAEQLSEQAHASTKRLLGSYERSGNELMFPRLPEQNDDERLNGRNACVYLDEVLEGLQSPVLFCFDVGRERTELDYRESDRCTAAFRLVTNAHLLSLLSQFPDKSESGDKLSTTLRIFTEDGRRSGLPEELWESLATKVEAGVEPEELKDELARMLKSVSEHLEKQLK